LLLIWSHIYTLALPRKCGNQRNVQRFGQLNRRRLRLRCIESQIDLSTVALIAKALYNFTLGLSAICDYQGLGSLAKPLLPRRLVNHNACRRSMLPAFRKRRGPVAADTVRSRGLVGDLRPRSIWRSLFGECSLIDNRRRSDPLFDFCMFDDDLSYIGIREVWEGHEPFGLSSADRRHHVYCVGKTGTGKTTLLRNLILQDFIAGRGVGVIDPHGDLARELLDLIPRRRTDDLVYFDPSDYDHPIGLDLFPNVPPRERHLIASGVVGAFKSIWREFWGPRLEYILYATIAKRLSVSPLTLQHELDVMDFRAAIVKAARQRPELSIAEISTWPAKIAFDASGEDGQRVEVRPDGFFRLIELGENGKIRQHSFYVEVDRSTESEKILLERIFSYYDYYRSGGFAMRRGRASEDYKSVPFRVLVTCQSTARRDNLAEQLVISHTKVGALAWITTVAEATEDLFGDIWMTPTGYHKATAEGRLGLTAIGAGFRLITEVVSNDRKFLSRG
jgi:hypothetical protein